MKAECWCYTTERTVTLNGETTGKRQAELFRVDDCQHKDCPKRLSRDCLIGKVLEGRWPWKLHAETVNTVGPMRVSRLVSGVISCGAWFIGSLSARKRCAEAKATTRASRLITISNRQVLVYCQACGKPILQGEKAYAKTSNGNTNYLCQNCHRKPILVYPIFRRSKLEKQKRRMKWFTKFWIVWKATSKMTRQ